MRSCNFSRYQKKIFQLIFIDWYWFMSYQEKWLQKVSHGKIASQKITRYENIPLRISPLWESPLWKLPPRNLSPKKLPLWKFPPRENYPPWNPLPNYKSYKCKKRQNYKISCLEDNCTQHNILIKITKVVFDTQMISQKIFELRYFLYRMKKIQKLNESENRQMAFTCQLYKSRRTKTRQSNYKIWQICETTK